MGKILLSTNNGLFSRAIRWLTKSPVSHASFLLEEDTISQSTFLHGVGVQDLNLFKSHQTEIRAFEIPDDDFDKANDIYRKKKGIMYGYCDILYSAIAIPLRRLLKFKNPIQDGLICSEYVSFYIDACMETKLNSSSYPPSPKDLLEWCEANLKEVKP